MENSRNQQVLDQIRLASLEVANGCGMANEIGATVEDVRLLVTALGEMHAAAERLLESMGNELDHDGDTQPGNAPVPGADPDLAVLKGADSFVEKYDAEPAWMRDRSPCAGCGHERDVHGPAGNLDALACHLTDCSCRRFWMRDHSPCAGCGHERDVHGPDRAAGNLDALACYLTNCSCRRFTSKG